jgi:hypothetical protein
MKKQPTIFDSCAELGNVLESYGGKPIWPPNKLRKNHARVTAQGEVEYSAGKKLLVGIVPAEKNQWSDFVLVGDDQTFWELRHRPFYAPSTLWYEFNIGSDRARARYTEFDETLAGMLEAENGKVGSHEQTISAQ